MWKKLKLSSVGGDSGCNKCKRLYGDACDRVSALGGILESGVRRWVLCWCVGRNLPSVAMKMFSLPVYFINVCYKRYIIIKFEKTVP
jgi:hypothetical protein